MSDVLPDLSDLPRPEPPESWRERLAGWAETLDLTPTRLLVGLAVLAVGGVVAWRMLAPPPLPPEMRLPFASTTVAPAAAAGADGSAAASGEPAAGATTGTGPSGSAEVTEVVVHVAGAVVAPGVQRLDSGARVIDAVDAAGGETPDADLARINLAAPLEDGQQIYVPRLGEPTPPAAATGTGVAGDGTGGAGSAGGSTGASSGALVDLNSASVAELEELPGVGPAIAQAIVDHREQEGPFTSVEGLLDVRGIGDAKLAQLRDLVTV
jgi:competence protein ComEA